MDILARVERLERQNRFLKWGAVVALAVVPIGLLAGARTSGRRTVEAEAFVVRDAQEAKPLGSLSLDLDRLKTWGTKVYTYEASRPGSSEKTIMGRVTLTTEVTGDLVVLKDRMEISFRGEKLSLDLTHRCKRDNYLSPVRIESKGEGDDEFGTFVVTVDGEKATVHSEGREREMELPNRVVTWSAFFRLVTLLPRKKGSRLSYPYSLESEELNLKKDFLVECMGRDTVQSGPERISCTKFRLTGGGNHPAFYWVGDDGVLRQVLIDERKLMRLMDEPNKDNGSPPVSPEVSTPSGTRPAAPAAPSVNGRG